MLLIRTKLILSNIAMIVIPAMVTLIAGLLLLGYTLGHSDGKWVSGRDYFHKISKDATELYVQFSVELKESPDSFLDQQFLENAGKRSAPYSTYIAVLQNGSLIYSSLPGNPEDAGAKLAEVITGKDVFERPVTINDVTYRVMNNAITFSDGSRGNVCLITDMSPFSSVARTYIGHLALIVLAALVLTSALLAWYMSRIILKPLEKLRRGAREIMAGNLDFEVPTGRNDEIGELCTEFDEMRKKLKESLEVQVKYEANRNELIGNISHDLRTPLSAVRGYVEGVLDGIADTPQKQSQYLNIAKSRIDDMERMIEDLLLYSKLDMQQLAFHIEALSPVEIINEIIQDYQADCKNLGIVMGLHLPETELPSVMADHLKLRRVLTNVLDNAIASMEGAGRHIDITLTGRGESVAFEVKDSGRGIAPEHLDHVFQRFYRADAARTSGKGGSGLGLAIVRQLTEGMGGTVGLSSTQGAGTVVTVVLPAGGKK